MFKQIFLILTLLTLSQNAMGAGLQLKYVSSPSTTVSTEPWGETQSLPGSLVLLLNQGGFTFRVVLQSNTLNGYSLSLDLEGVNPSDVELVTRHRGTQSGATAGVDFPGDALERGSDEIALNIADTAPPSSGETQVVTLVIAPF